MTLFYQYVVSPLKTVQLASARGCGRSARYALAVFSLFMASFAPHLSVYSLFVTASVVLVGLFFIVVIIDFFAQLLGNSAHTLRLYQWLLLSLSYCMFLQPILVLSTVLPDGIVTVLQMGWTLFMAVVQVHTIQHIYQVSGKKALLLWAGPFFAVGILFSVLIAQGTVYLF